MTSSTTFRLNCVLMCNHGIVIQFCCGSEQCDKANVPIGTRGIDFLQGGSSGPQGVYLQFENGTTIEPLAVGLPQVSSSATLGSRGVTRRCDGYKKDSYVANGDIYVRTFETEVASSNVPAFEEARAFKFQHSKSASRTTTFEASVGDPWGIISVSTGLQFQNTTSDSQEVSVEVPAGQSGYIGFTPYYRCTKGTLETCDGKRTEEHESCTPYLQGTSQVLRGDYMFVQT